LSTKKKSALSLEQRIENIIHDKFAHMLADVDFRIQQAYSVAGRGEGRSGKVYAEDLNLIGRHMLTGYTVTNNSPAAGSIAWVDLHMVYSGTDHLITNGNTANMYVWWSPTTTPTVLQSSNTKPTLGAGEVLLFMNGGLPGKAAGTHTVMLSDTNASLPTIVAPGTINSGDINGRAIGTAQIALQGVDSTILKDDAVTSAKIGSGAINDPTFFANSPVNSTVLANGAVVAGKIAGSAINSDTLFTAGVVNANAIGPDAVTNDKIYPGAVNTTELAQNAVDATILKDNAVTGTKILDSAVGAAKIAGGAITPTKLNIMRHVLY
jgi:hypothetical protein